MKRDFPITSENRQRAKTINHKFQLAERQKVLDEVTSNKKQKHDAEMLAIQKILDSNIECEDMVLNNYNTDSNVETTDVGVVDKLEHFVDKSFKVEHLKAFIHCRSFTTSTIPKGKGHPKKGTLEFANAGFIFLKFNFSFTLKQSKSC